MLISSGKYGKKLWNLNNFELIKYFEEAKCWKRDILEIIDEDRIIIGGNKILRIISLLGKK